VELQSVFEDLAFYVSTDYNFIKFKHCVYYDREDKLEILCIYDGRIENKLDALKSKLEQEFKSYVRHITGETFDFVFNYEKKYIDIALLKLAVHKFFRSNFSVFIDGLADDFVDIIGDDQLIVNIYLPQQVVNFVSSHKSYIEFIKSVEVDYFIDIQFNLIERKSLEDTENPLEELKKLVREERKPEVDKKMKIDGKIEYYMGLFTKDRPVKIKYLAVRLSEQVIAGHIENLVRREYTSKKDGQKKPFFTFALNDFEDVAPCVYFVPQKSLSKFEKLEEGTFVVLVGVNSERNGRVSFVVSGISLVNTHINA